MPDNLNNPDLAQAVKLLGGALTSSKQAMESIVAGIEATLEALKGLDLSPLPDVEGVSLEAVSADSITVSWEPFEGATGWEVSAYSDGVSEAVVELTDPKLDTYTLTGLEPNTTYLVTVLALNTAGNSIASGSVDATTTKAPVGTLDVKLVSQTQSTVKINWPAAPGAVAYEVSRDGTDRTGYGIWDGQTQNTAWTFEQLRASSEYRLGVTALSAKGIELAAGLIHVTTMPEPEAPKPTPGKITRVDKSGLVADSLVFLGGSADRRSTELFGASRGRPMDGALTFPGRGSWDQIAAGLKPAQEMVRAGYRVVYSMPHAPESEGDQMNQRGANDAYRSAQVEFGQILKSLGLVTPLMVLRVDWEFNGNWYRWSGNRPGGKAALKGALSNFQKNVQAGAGAGNLFDLCENKRPSQSGVTWDDVLPEENRDNWVLGTDQYDHWGSSTTEAQWAAEVRKGIGAADDASRRLGCLGWALDETGNSWGESGGRDNPMFWRFLAREIYARRERCVWFNTYNHDGAPATLKHRFDHNPKSWDVYRGDFLTTLTKK